MVTRRCEIGIVPFKIVRDAKAEFTDDGRPIAAAVVMAGETEVSGGGAAGAGVVDAVVVRVFYIAVVVVGGEVVVREVLVGVAGAPFCILRFCTLSVKTHKSWEERWSYHHLNMETIVRADVEGSLGSSNTGPRGGIVRSPH